MSNHPDCIFCDILAQRQPASFVFQDEQNAAFLDIHPINPGHVLVIPRRHAASLAELDEKEGARLFQVAQRVAAALRRCPIQCEGVNLFLADGRVAGQEVFHVHLHVIPRFKGDGFGLRRRLGFGRPPSRPDLDTLAQHIHDVY